MILTQENPLLRQIAQEVDNFKTQELKELVAQMLKIMENKHGVGLAAPQIGISKRIMVYGFEFNPRYPDAKPVSKNYIINPQILLESPEQDDFEEGCLSVPNTRGIVSRAKHIRYSGFDIDGNNFEKEASGFEARIILHELDHLNGVLFIDKASSLTTKTLEIEKINNL